MRSLTAALSLTLTLAAACSLGDDDTCRAIELGACARPAGAVDVPATTLASTGERCLIASDGALAIATSAAEWDALFSCPTPVPDGLGFEGRRLAVLATGCAPTELRFAVETTDAVVLGVYRRISGACFDAPLVVALPASTRPVQLATCNESSEGDCPPVP